MKKIVTIHQKDQWKKYLCNFEDLSEKLIIGFRTSLLSFVTEKKIISIFCRLHPFINQNLLVRKFGGIWGNGKIIVMDLTVPLQVQRAKYPKVYSKIKQLKRLGYKSWRYIVDPGAYEDILHKFDIDTKSNIDFFPLYRCRLHPV